MNAGLPHYDDFIRTRSIGTVSFAEMGLQNRSLIFPVLHEFSLECLSSSLAGPTFTEAVAYVVEPSSELDVHHYYCNLVPATDFSFADSSCYFLPFRKAEREIFKF